MQERQDQTNDSHLGDLLSAYIDGRLTPGERLRVETHLPSCAACRAELVAMQETIALLKALPVVATPRPFYIYPAMVPARRARFDMSALLRPAWAYGALKLATTAAVMALVLVVSADALTMTSFQAAPAYRSGAQTEAVGPTQPPAAAPVPQTAGAVPTADASVPAAAVAPTVQPEAPKISPSPPMVGLGGPPPGDAAPTEPAPSTGPRSVVPPAAPAATPAAEAARETAVAPVPAASPQPSGPAATASGGGPLLTAPSATAPAPSVGAPLVITDAKAAAPAAAPKPESTPGAAPASDQAQRESSGIPPIRVAEIGLAALLAVLAAVTLAARAQRQKKRKAGKS